MLLIYYITCIVEMDALQQQAGGSTQPLMVKKIEKKAKILGRERCVYVDCKQREYVKVKGAYMRLVEARKL